MSTTAKKWLFDVSEACRAIAAFCAGRSFADYKGNELLRAATERKFEIIGEALGKLRDRKPAVFLKISEGAAIIGFRNRLIHGYDSVDDAIVWDIVQNKLPALKKTVDRLLKEAD